MFQSAGFQACYHKSEDDEASLPYLDGVDPGGFCFFCFVLNNNMKWMTTTHANHV